MSDDALFRKLMLIGFVAFLPIGLFHRIRSRTGEKLDRRQEGLCLLIGLRLLGLAALASFLAYLINPTWMAWASFRLPLGVRWAGIGLAFIGGALLAWTVHCLGRNLTDTVVTRRDHQLVTHGPYRWVRHPFYGSAALAFLGNSLAAANLFLLSAGFLVILLLALRTPKEEERLIARFGDAYRDYMKRTGRFLPRW